MSVRSDIGPFAILPEWLLYSGISSNAIRLFAILHRHDGAGGCHPGRKRLASLMGCSESTIDRTLRELVAAQAVTIEERFDPNGDRTSSEYTLTLASPVMRGVVTSDATPLVMDDATPSSPVTNKRKPLNESPLNENGADAPTPLFSDLEKPEKHQPITPKFLTELQAANPDVDVQAIYERVRNLRRWDGYKDKRRALTTELGYERERRDRFAAPQQPKANPAGVTRIDDPNYAPNRFAAAREARQRMMQ